MGHARWTVLLPWAAAIVVGVIYLPVLGFDYVWDDWLLFIHNPGLRRPELVWHTIFSPIISGTAYFRPLVLGSFALEFGSAGINPALSHGVNLLIHLANSVLVGLILLRLTTAARLTGQAWRVLLATLLYGLHPALIEPAAWAAGRFDLMVTLFCLLAIWAYLTWADWRRNLWVTLCFVLAALSKEMAVTLPLLLFLFYLGRQPRTATWSAVAREWLRSGEWRLVLLLSVAGLGLLVARLTLMGRVPYSDLAVDRMLDGPLHHLAFIGQTLLFYLRMSLWPFSDLNPQHPLNPSDLDSTARWIGLTTLGLAILAGALLVRRRTWPALLFAGWLVALLPVLNIAPLFMSGNIGQERFLALPLALLVLGICTLSLPSLSPGMTRMIPAAIGALAVGFLALSLVNIRVTLPLWKNELSLWTWAYTRYPDRLTVQMGYAAAALRYQRYDLAKAVFDNARRPLPYPLAAHEGEYLISIDRPAEALAAFEQATAGLAGPHRALLARGIALEDATLTEPDPQDWLYRQTYTGIAEAHLRQHDFQPALDAARIALFYSPHYPTALMMKSFARYGLGQWEEGEAAFAIARDYFTPDAQAESRTLRTQFLTQLCAANAHPPSVCDHWSTERAAPVEPKSITPSKTAVP